MSSFKSLKLTFFFTCKRNNLICCISKDHWRSMGFHSICSMCHYCCIPLISLSCLFNFPLQMCLQRLSHPPLPSSALCLCPAPRRTSERGSCVNWVSLSPASMRQHTHAYRQKCANFSVRHGKGAECILATGDVLCPSLQPTPSCTAHSPDTAVPAGSDTIWLIYLYWFIRGSSCAA